MLQLRIYEIFEVNKAAFHARFRDHAGLSPPSPFGQVRGAPARRGLPVSTRSISVQLGGPVNQLIFTVYRTHVLTTFGRKM